MNCQSKKKNTSFSSCFDVIGPVMVGPSSSHTAGAINIGSAAKKVFQDVPNKILVNYYESFAETHQGHGTDFAIVAGVLGFDYDDPRVPDSVIIANEEGIEVQFIENAGDSPFGHPNTADIILSNDEKQIRLAGISVGGGKIEVRLIEINHFVVEPKGCLPALLLISKDKNLSEVLAKEISDNQVVIKNQINAENSSNYLTYYEIEHHFPYALYKEFQKMQAIDTLVLL